MRDNYLLFFEVKPVFIVAQKGLRHTYNLTNNTALGASQKSSNSIRSLCSSQDKIKFCITSN